MTRPSDPHRAALDSAAAAVGRPLSAAERVLVIRAAEVGSHAAMLAAASPPPECGPEPPVAFARSFRVVSFSRVVSQATDRRAPAGYLGRSTVVAADIWDRMEAAALRRHVAGGGAAAAFEPPFAPHQVVAGRTYAAVAERFAAGGMHCGSAETRKGERGAPARAGGGLAEALLDDGRWLAAARAAIGPGVALHPSPRGRSERERPLTLAVLVELVALEGRTLSEVLRRFGWPLKGSMRAALRSRLAETLDRISAVPGPPDRPMP